jgi:hypothetical protein
LFKQSTFFQEPSESLAELQRQRALEIRNKYSYVRLWLSGGADSITALNAFLDNDKEMYGDNWLETDELNRYNNM